MFPSFELFGRPIATYGLCVLVGMAACWFAGTKMIKKRGITLYDFTVALILAFFGLAIGAVLLFGLTNIERIINILTDFGKLNEEIGFWDTMGLLAANFSGMVFYGGFIGAGLTLVIVSRHNKGLRGKRGELLDIFAVLVPLFHGFGRIGCFFGGCCYGIECEFGYTIHNNDTIPGLSGVNRFPVQLMESGCNFILFFVLLTLFRKHIMEKRLIYVYMLTYPVIRFLDEFLRGDAYRGFLFGLSTSQWVSIILFVFAIIMLPIQNKKLNNSEVVSGAV